MKLAYLVLVHDNPVHFRRLMGQLSSGSGTIFVHVDRKSSIEDFSFVSANVRFLHRRVAVYWGDFSIVEATLRLLDAALKADTQFDYLILLSGADYPIKPITYINDFFIRNKGREFINIVSMPNEEVEKPLSRLTRYRHQATDPMVIRRMRSNLTRIGLLSDDCRNYAKAFEGMLPYAGSAWWALSFEACQYISTVVRQRQRLVRFFRNTTTPDESFFQTIIGNSIYVERAVRNLTYTDWSEGKAHPSNIGERHLKHIVSPDPVVKSDPFGEGELLFARKFTDASGFELSHIDRLLN